MFKEFISKIIRKFKTAYDYMMVALGKAPETKNEDGVEVFMIGDEQIPVNDEAALEAKAEEITETVIKVLTTGVLAVMSLFLVNEFFFWILIGIELFVVYSLLDRFIYGAKKELVEATA